MEIRNAQSRPLAGATLLLLDNGYFAEASLAMPEVRVRLRAHDVCILVGRWAVHHLAHRMKGCLESSHG